MATIRIKSSHPESQGPFVEIDDANFDAETMELYSEVNEPVTAPEISEEPSAPVEESAPVTEPDTPVTEPVMPQPWAKR